MRIKLGMSE